MQEHPVVSGMALLRAGLAELADVTLWSLVDAESAELVSDVYQGMARFQEFALRAVGDADRRGLAAAAGATSTASWLAGTQRLRRETASAQVHLARALRDERPATGAALAAGAVNVEQAQVIARAVEELPDEAGPQVRAEAEARLLAEAERHDARALRILGRRVLEVVDPDAADAHEGRLLARQEAVALDRREHTFREDLDTGMVTYFGRTDVLTGRLWQSALEAVSAPRLTDADGPDTRPYRRRLGDAMASLVERASAAADLPEHGGRRPTLLVNLPFDTLVSGLRAGTLDTGQPISPEAVRRLACDAELIPAVLGSHGQVLDLGRAARLFTLAQRLALAVRDRGCAFPGCDRPPSWTETHHLRPWSAGGRTDLADGVLLCGHHHRVIHDGHWQVRAGPDGQPQSSSHPPGSTRSGHRCATTCTTPADDEDAQRAVSSPTPTSIEFWPCGVDRARERPQTLGGPCRSLLPHAPGGNGKSGHCQVERDPPEANLARTLRVVEALAHKAEGHAQ